MVVEGHGKLINRKTKTSGKEYDRFFFYVPTEVARDGLFPFKDGTKVTIKIDAKNKSIVVEGEKDESAIVKTAIVSDDGVPVVTGGAIVKTAIVKTAIVKTAIVKTAIVKTAIVSDDGVPVVTGGAIVKTAIVKTAIVSDDGVPVVTGGAIVKSEIVKRKK